MAVSATRNRVIEGDDIQAQIDALPEQMYLTRTNPNNPAIWETYNPKTGEIIDTGTFAGGGDRGLMAAAAPVIGLAASTVGLPFISGMLGGATGLTGSALSGITGATIGGGTTALAGGTTEDILKGALLAGGGAYGSSLLDNYLSTGSFADPGLTERQLALADAKQLANQGLSQNQIAEVLNSSGYPEAIVDRAVASISSSSNVTTPATTIPTVSDNVVVTGTGTPPVNVGGMLTNLTTPTVTVTDSNTPNQANQEIIKSIIATTPSVVTPESIPTKTIIGDRPTTINDVVTPATIPLIQPSTPLEVTPVKAEDKNTNTLGLTDAQIANLLKAGLGLFGTLGATTALSNNQTTMPVGALPTQTPPLYTEDYYKAIQQNYNSLLPSMPRDVSTPLMNWYNSKYGS